MAINTDMYIHKKQFGNYIVYFCNGDLDHQGGPTAVRVNGFPEPHKFLYVKEETGVSLKKKDIVLQPGETQMIEIGQIFFLTEGELVTPLGHTKVPPSIIAQLPYGYNDQFSDEPRHIECKALTPVKGVLVWK